MELYKVHEVDSQNFYKIPKDLFNNPCYKYNLTTDEKLIYTLLLDRMKLSQLNGWMNEKEEVFLLFTKQEVAEVLGLVETTVYKAFRSLELLQLIQQQRQGRNKPNKIFIAKIDQKFRWTCKICRSWTCNLRRSGHAKNEG